MSIYHKDHHNPADAAGWTCKNARPVLHIKAAALAMSAVFFLTSCGSAPVSQADSADPPAQNTEADETPADMSSDLPETEKPPQREGFSAVYVRISKGVISSGK